ncbi:glycosyltransferase [Sulfuriroseicoccus oceanibius]|uniref:Glycosyltransferase n=2 Tax=Sulfuriroseicoccus oceanibius TaxID=2707525 RepID=A0A6B3L5Z6_9BACT|nr:glycosyltransferase [Sulfuriroseicoccus oceanibius]
MNWETIIWIISYAIVLVGLCSYGIHRYTLIYLYWKHSKQEPKPAKKWDELPVVTVQLPVFNEQYVMERLLGAVSKINYPQDKLQIQILDDSTDETVEICQKEAAKLRAQGFDVEYLHRTDRTGFKAGALEAGTKSAKGDFLFILDADFVPGPEIIMDMIHFFTDEKIGMVQTRWGHLNREYSLLTRVQAMFLDGHLLLEQTSRNRSGRFFTFNGTGGMWRKQCIEDAGGWEYDTLTEDMDLSYRAQLKGWNFIFLKDVVCPAELPVDMDGFKSQQHRWTKGSIQTCKKMLGTIWKAPVPLYIKLEATAHLTANFAYLLLIFLCVYSYPAWPEGITPELGRYLSLPIFLFASLSIIIFYIVAQHQLHPRTWWREALNLPLLLALGIGMSINNQKAVLEAIFNHKSGFVRTPKYGIGEKKEKKDITKSRYKALKSVATVLEIVFAAWFAYATWFAISEGTWMSVPFLSIFTFGFLYVAYGSAANRFNWGKNKDVIIDTGSEDAVQVTEK